MSPAGVRVSSAAVLVTAPGHRITTPTRPHRAPQNLQHSPSRGGTRRRIPRWAITLGFLGAHVTHHLGPRKGKARGPGRQRGAGPRGAGPPGVGRRGEGSPRSAWKEPARLTAGAGVPDLRSRGNEPALSIDSGLAHLGALCPNGAPAGCRGGDTGEHRPRVPASPGPGTTARGGAPLCSGCRFQGRALHRASLTPRDAPPLPLRGCSSHCSENEGDAGRPGGRRVGSCGGGNGVPDHPLEVGAPAGSGETRGWARDRPLRVHQAAPRSPPGTAGVPSSLPEATPRPGT